MSRGQKPRTPAYFPRMKDRAWKRRPGCVRIVFHDGLCFAIAPRVIPAGPGSAWQRGLDGMIR